MSCKQTRLLQRLAVEDPETLRTEPWRIHLQHCGPCSAGRAGLERSLAVFRQIEGERLLRAFGPQWEAFAEALQRDRRARQRRRLRASFTAAAVLIVLATGGGLYEAIEALEPKPAKIVRARPEQQRHLLETLQNTLVDGAPVRYVVSAADRLAGVTEAGRLGETAPVEAPPHGLDAWTRDTREPDDAVWFSGALPLSTPVWLGSAGSRGDELLQPAASSFGISGVEGTTVYPVPTR